MIKLDERLKTIAGCAREETFFYDIGTDHGYLPVFLVLSGKTEKAVAADIAPLPLSKAERTVRENLLCDRIKTVLSDGLDKIELEYPCDIAIAGMGGDTICSILSRKPEIKSRSVKLILQPMTKQYELRKFLIENRFKITEEHLAKDGKIYQIICAEWDGKKRNVSDADLFLGAPSGELKKEYLTGRKETLSVIIEGKKKAGIDCLFEEKICKRIEELLK